MRTLLDEKLPSLTAAQRDKLAAYFDLLIQANERMNLTAITAPDEAADKHFVDSLLALAYIPQGASCIDVGTGAGFPGIPLLIARPDLRMTLLDSLNKRVAFLQETLAALGLTAACIHARAEDAAKSPPHRGVYDIALSRAVAPLPVLLELTVPFLRVGGVSICYKGSAAREEAQSAQSACKALNCTLEFKEFSLPYGERTLILAKKTGPTPARYPRKAGEPSRKPL